MRYYSNSSNMILNILLSTIFLISRVRAPQIQLSPTTTIGPRPFRHISQSPTNNLSRYCYMALYSINPLHFTYWWGSQTTPHCIPNPYIAALSIYLCMVSQAIAGIT